MKQVIKDQRIYCRVCKELLGEGSFNAAQVQRVRAMHRKYDKDCGKGKAGK